MSDRTGELCPFCRKGKLYPSGKRDFVEPAKKPRNGETRSESTEYECDHCGRRPKAVGIHLTATVKPSAEPKVSDDKKPKKKDRERCKSSTKE